MFEVGDKVIYPNQGVGTIQDVCMKKFGGEEAEFYMVHLNASESTVMVPVANAETIGMRRLSNKKQVGRLFDILQSDFSEPDPDWKTRYKLNLEKMNSGEVCEVAEVLKHLYLLSSRKSLSFREKKMFDRARQLVISEIATVKNQGFDETVSEVDEILDRAFQESPVNGNGDK